MSVKKKRKRLRINYSVGDWFGVPISKGKAWAIGVVARGKSKVLLGYFFGPKRNALPMPSDLTHLRATDAVLVRRFGDLGLITKRWPIIGRTENWKQKNWPNPKFIGFSPGIGPFLIRYADDEPAEACERRYTRSKRLSGSYPEAVMSGHLALEVDLEEIL